MKRLILLMLTATVLNSALLTIKPVEKIEATTLRKSYFDGPEDYYDRFYERPNDWPNLATNPYTFNLVSREEAETNDYQFHLDANLFHDYYCNHPDGSYSYYPDNDFYLLNVFYTSDIKITLSGTPASINNGNLVCLQLYRYSNYYGDDDPVYLMQNGWRVDGSTIKLDCTVPHGDYCIRVGSTPDYEEKYISDPCYNSEDNYQLDVSVKKTNEKYKISEGKISIGEMQYNLGAYGAIWKADLSPFGFDDFISNEEKITLRVLSNNYGDLIKTLPFSEDEYSNSIYKFYTSIGCKDYLTSKIYIWDPTILTVLREMFKDTECRDILNTYIQDGSLEQKLNELEDWTIEINNNVTRTGLVKKFFDLTKMVLSFAGYKMAATVVKIFSTCIKLYSSVLKSYADSLIEQINSIEERRAIYVNIEAFLDNLERLISGDLISNTERKGICVNNYVNVAKVFNPYKNQTELKLNFTSHIDVENIFETDIKYADNRAAGDGTGTIYLLRSFENIQNELVEVRNYEQYLPNYPKIWDYYETIPINERTYASESKEYVLHDGEFKWHSLKNTGFQTKTYRVVLDSLSDIEVSGEVFDALYFEGYSNKNAISEFTVVNTGTTKRKIVNVTIEPRYTIFFKVYISNWQGLPAYNSTVKYQIGLDDDYAASTDDFVLYKAQDFGFTCEYNNIFEDSINLNHGSVYGAKYSRLRCGYIEESEFNRKYLTLSSQSQKHRTVDTAFLDITFDRSVIKASVDLAAWSTNENFNENSRVIISVLVDDYEMQYRNLPISYIGPNKDHLSRFYIDPGFSFDGIEIKVVSNTNVKPERKNAGRVVLDNLYFEFE